MGGFGGAIVRGLESVAEKVPSNPEFRAGVDAVVGTYTDHLHSMRANLSTSEGGKALIDLLENQVEPRFQKNLQMHSEAAAQQLRSTNLPKSSVTSPASIKVQAKNEARAAVGGKKDQVFGALIRHIHDNDGPEKAQYAVDALGTYFQEQTQPDAFYGKDKQLLAAGHESSTLVKNLSKNPITRDILFSSSKYQPPTKTEKIVTGITSAALASKSGLAHISQQFNLPLDQSVSSYVKALGSITPGIGSYAKAKAELQMAGVAGTLAHDELTALYQRKYGLAKYLPKGRVGDFVAKNFFIPGMPAIKEFNMVVAGMQGKFRAAELADTLVKGGTTAKRAAVSDAARLGLDWKKIESGGLTQQDIETAMYHHINNTVFFNSPLNRSMYALNSPHGRMISMYHNFALQQSKLIFNNIKRSLVEKHDPVSVVKLATMLGVVAPAVAFGLEELKNLAMGRDWDDPGSKFVQNEEEFYSPENWNTKLEAMSHIMGYGLVVPYIRASGRYKLAEALAGAAGGTGIEFLQDTSHVLSDPENDAAQTQLMRDVLHDVPSVGIGAAMSNIFLPTQTSRGGRSRRVRRR